MPNNFSPDTHTPNRNLLTGCLYALCFCATTFAADVFSHPLAWIHFNRDHKDIALFNGYPMYFVSGGGLELNINVNPDPGHSLAFMWLCKENPGRGSNRSMKLRVNGAETVRTHPAVGDQEGVFFWDIVPVTAFGINERAEGHYHIVANRNPEEHYSSVVLQGIRLITDEKQLETLPLPTSTHKVQFIHPGPLTEDGRLDRKVNRDAARKRIHQNWVGKKKLSKRAIKADEFLSAAQKFADTAITHGRDEYGAETSAIFVQHLNRETLKAPGTIGWLKPSQGGPNHPMVLSRFERSQNLLRFLASMSLFTGDPRYSEAVMDSMICMFEDYIYPRSGLLAFGNHMSIDLVEGKAYSDGRGSEQFELQDTFPFYEFFYDVSPDKTSRFIKGIWESYVRNWHSMRYNRHANFNTQVDVTKVWNRPVREVADLPEFTQGGELSFIGLAYDLAYSGFTLGCVEDDVKARIWANRILEVVAAKSDRKTGVWPMMLYPPPFYRRGLETYVDAYPDSNANEARVIISSWVNSVPIHALGVLGTIEQAQKHDRYDEVRKVHAKVDQWILNYMQAAYDPEAHHLRSILLDGQDVTDLVFTEDATLYGWGAQPGGSFRHRPVTPAFFAAVAQGFRLCNSPESKAHYWKLLRNLYRGAGLGDIGENIRATPAFNYGAKAQVEDGYVFGLSEIYRVTRAPETLRFMEHLGREIIQRRQDPKSGLFVVEAHRELNFPALKEFKQSPHEGITVKEMMREKFGTNQLDYDRPKVVPLNITEPLALLAIHGCRTGEFEKIPSWISIGMSHHSVIKEQEIWFDRPKLENYYEDRKDYIKDRGFVVNEDWFPRR